MVSALVFVGGLALGLLLGGALVAAHAAHRSAREREALRVRLATAEERLLERERQFGEQGALLERADTRLREAFQALGGEALSRNSEEFLRLAGKTFDTLLEASKGDVEKKQQAIDALLLPIRELLDKQSKAVTEMETKRERAYATLDEQVKAIAASHQALGTETSKLVAALRRPEQRGRWGELQLRNVVELAGMTLHCDFDEQPSVSGDEGRLRPDMTVRLPGGGVIVVDSKVALDAYLDALQPDGDRRVALERHADQVERHFRKLSAKKYWEQFDRAPQVVVMFMPLESALVAALEVKPSLHANALQERVLIATPTLLVALLRAVAYGWQQEAVAENAREIAAVGAELHERLAKFVEHHERVGRSLQQSVAAYNASVGSLERMVLPSTRKLKALGATVEAEVEAPEVLAAEIRQVTAPELLLPRPVAPVEVEGRGGPAT